MEYVCGEVLFPGLQNFLLKGDLRYYPAKEKWLQLIENTTIFIAAPPCYFFRHSHGGSNVQRHNPSRRDLAKVSALT